MILNVTSQADFGHWLTYISSQGTVWDGYQECNIHPGVNISSAVYCIQTGTKKMQIQGAPPPLT